MDKIVVLSCGKFSSSFEKKIITIHEGQTVSLRRASKNERAAKSNGLFDYPKHFKISKLSRNHAEITCRDSKVYLTAISPNTFINNNRIEPGGSGHLIENDDTICLGGLSQDMYDSIVAIVSIFSSTDEQYKYFCQLETDYPFICSLPESPPSWSMKTEDLFSVTMNRLEVLKHLSRFGEDELTSPETIRMVIKSIETTSYVDMFRYKKFHSNYKKRHKLMEDDHVSQFILALAFCRRRHLRYWFIDQERKLFIIRWYKMFPQEKVDFLLKYHMDYEEVLHSELSELSSLYSDFFVGSMKYYKVHFTKARIFVKRRKVYLHDGFCFISIEDMYAPIIEHLQRLLSSILKTYNTNLPKIWWDHRIRSIILYVQKTICGADRYKSTNGEVTEKNIHQMCDESFPLCMKILQYHLSRDHHLRNGGRYQYTLFLKGIGLSLSSSLTFWKTHFTKKIEETVFMKRYSYHIRHAYGTEGKMADYSPRNCSEIMKEVPGPLEYHGCPFKVLDTVRVKDALNRSCVDGKDHIRILEYVQNGSPQEACGLYFELTHGEKYPHSSVVHPNLYYDQSRKVRLRQRERVKVKFDSLKDTVSKLDSAGAINRQCTPQW